MISVIIPNFNGKHLLKPCLDSLLRQNGVEFEVIVVDNGSTDGSVEFIKENYPSVKVVQLEENVGFCKAVNCGIKIAKGEEIATLNNDTEVDPNWLKELYCALYSHPEIGLCASKVLLYDQKDLIDTAGDAYTIAGFGYKRGYRQKDEQNYNERGFVFGASACAAIYKKEMLLKIGLFDEDLFAFNDDIDLSFRAQLAGYKCLYVPTARVYHRVRATFGKNSDYTIYLGYRNLILVMMKNLPLKFLILHLHSILIHTLAAIIAYSLKGKAIPMFRAVKDAIKDWRKFLKKRKYIQNMRTVSDEYLYSILDKHWIKAMYRLSSFFK